MYGSSAEYVVLGTNSLGFILQDIRALENLN